MQCNQCKKVLGNFTFKNVVQFLYAYKTPSSTDKRNDKLGLSCAKLRSSYASWPDGAHFTLHLYLVLYLPNIWGCHPFTKIFAVVFYLQIYLRSSSIYKKIWGRLPFTNKIEVVFHLQKKVRSSSIYKKGEVVFHTYDRRPVYLN